MRSVLCGFAHRPPFPFQDRDGAGSVSDGTSDQIRARGVNDRQVASRRAESRSGAVVWGPVSTPRSSNRTGRFPTSGFRTRHFRQSLTEWPALTSCETLPPKLTLKVSVGEAYLPAATHSEFRARPLTHPVINMLGDQLGRLAACPEAEYVGPTLYLAVDLSNSLVNFQACGIPAGHHAHFVT